MKHIFVINPYAGKQDSSNLIIDRLKAYDGKLNYETYITKAPGDATLFAKNWCTEHPGEPVRFYACGGDGTINEVVSGIMDYEISGEIDKSQVSNLKSHIQMTCYPSGSGNDYIKYYGTQADFFDLDRLIDGIPHKVDVMRVSPGGSSTSDYRYSINVCNYGFDAEVCRTMIQVKRKPIIGGSRAYTTGIVKNIFTSRRNYSRIYVDGQQLHDGKMLLCTLSNGQYVGGAYKCAPRSKNDDGLLEICLFKPMLLLQFISLIGKYSKGEHLDNPRAKKHLKYCQGTVVEMSSPKPFYVTIDGEMIYSTRFRVENIPQAVTFVSPR